MAIKPLNSVAGFSVGETPSNIILANGDVTTTNITTTGIANLNAIGNVRVTGGSSGQVIQTDGAGNLSFVTISTSSLQNGTSNIQVLSSANLTFSSAGNANVMVITGSGANITGTISTSGNANVGNLGTGGLITATGNITGANLVTGGVLSVTGNANIGNIGTAGLITATGNIGGGNINTGGLVTATGNGTFGNVITAGIMSSTGNATHGNISTGGLITATGNITSSAFLVGANLSITGNANVGNLGTAGLITATGNIGGGNINTTGLVNAGTLTVSGVSNLGAVGNVTITGGSANYLLQTNGSGALSWVAPPSTSTILNGNSNVNIPTSGGNVNTSVNGNANIFVVTGTGANVNGTFSVSGNSNVGNIGTGGLITATGNITGANIITAGNVSVGTYIVTPALTDLVFLPSTSITRNYGNLDPYTGGYYLGGAVRWTGVRANSGDFATTLSATGNANVGNLGTAGLITATGNITGGNLVTGGVLSVTGNANIGNIGTAGLITATGNVTAGNLVTGGVLSVSGTSQSSIAGNLTMNSKNIVSLADPVGAQDAATKNYVDGVAQGLDIKASVNYATAAALPAYTYNNGTSGVGATITINATGVLTIDGQTAALNDRILVKNETSSNAPYNGIYYVSTAGAVGVAAVLTRALDFNQPAEMYSAFTFVEYGDTLADTGWVCTNNSGSPITVGTTAITFSQFSGAGTYAAGTGLTLTGTTFSVNTAQPTITSVGTLTSLSVSGNANIGNIGTAGILSAGGNANVANLGVTGVFATTLSSTGNANVGNLGTGGLITATGNIGGGNLNTAGTANAAILTVSGNANIGNIGTGGLITATGNIRGANLVTPGVLSVTGNANIGNIGTAGIITATGNVTGGNLIATAGANIATNLGIGNGTVNTTISWASATTTTITANQTIANTSVTGITGVEYLVKAVDSTGGKYSVATVQAVTDGTNVDYATFGTVQLGGYTGSLAVNVSGGYIKLQVTPASTNSTVWTTQYRFI